MRYSAAKPMGADDEDYTSRSFKALLFVGLLLCVAGFKSWQDFRFATSGRQGTATVTKTVEDRDRLGRTTGYKLYFDFFNENTKKPSHHFTIISVGDVDRYPVGQQMEIDYYGGKYPSTRLHGTNNRLWVYFFFGSLTALAALIAYLSISTAREDKRPERSRRKR